MNNLPVATAEEIGIGVTLKVLDRETKQILFYRERRLIGNGTEEQLESNKEIQEWASVIRRHKSRTAKTYAITHGFLGNTDYESGSGEEHKNWVHGLIDEIIKEEKSKQLLDGEHKLVCVLAFDWRLGAGGSVPQLKPSFRMPILFSLPERLVITLSELAKDTICYNLPKYPQAAGNVKVVGAAIGEFLSTFSEILPSKDVYLIGFSLGAHVMGFAGKRYNKLQDETVGRITGLDPARPLFDKVEPKYRLNETDAAFVDAIHTNAGIMGIALSVGHADFWVSESPKGWGFYDSSNEWVGLKWGCLQPACADFNHKVVRKIAFKLSQTVGGKPEAAGPQEGAISDFVAMSHYRAHMYYRLSITERDLFQGRKVADDSKTATMGFHCSSDTRGDFNVKLDENNQKLKERYF